MPPDVLIRSKAGEFLIQEGLVGNKYRLVTKEGSELPEDVGRFELDPVGGGGFGCVVRAVDPLGIHRAIKLTQPPPGLLGVSEDDTDLFEIEIKLTNAKPFKNIIPVMDYGVQQGMNGKKFGFFVSHFVEGLRFGDFVREILQCKQEILGNTEYRNVISDAMLILLDEILAALVELDRANVCHLDLKPQNILVSPPINPRQLLDTAYHRNSTQPAQAFVIDLGAGKPLFPPMRGRTHLRTSPYWFPEEIFPNLEFLADDGKISYEKLQHYGRDIDIYMFGRILEASFLDRCKRPTRRYTPQVGAAMQEHEKETFWRELFGDDFLVLQGMIDRMLEIPHKPEYSKAHTVRLKLQTIPLRCARGVLTSEVLTDRYPGVLIRTGGSLVQISPPFEKMVVHPSFQRLRLFQQLAFVSEIFPDGTHTRFSHSLRTFHLAKLAVWALNRKSTFRLLFQKQDVDELLAAALLHDIGQYPFSHSIEDLRKIGDLCKDLRLSSIAYDQEQVPRVLEEKDALGVSIAKLLSDYGLSVENILYIISKTPKEASKPPVLNLGRDLITGIIDLDRISYLVHDSENTGVPYGKAIDVGSLISALTVRWTENANPSEMGLGIEEAGVSAAEAVLTAVYWMYRNVYWRHTNRAFMAAIKYVMYHLLHNDAITFEKYWSATHSFSDWESLKFLYGQYNLFLQGRLDEMNPLSSLANFRRIGYRRVLSIRYVEDEDEGHLYDSIATGFSPDKENRLLDRIKGFLPASAKPKKGEILIDVPLKRRLLGRTIKGKPEDTIGDRSIKSKVWVCTRGTITREVREWVDLYTYSPLAGSLNKIEDHSGRKIRIFFARELLARLSLNEQIRIERDLIRELYDEVHGW